MCLSDTTPTSEALAVVPLNIARRCRALPLAIEDHILTVAMADPRDEESLAVLATTAKLSIFPVLSSTAEIAAALDLWAQQPIGEPTAQHNGRHSALARGQRRKRRHTAR